MSKKEEKPAAAEQPAATAQEETKATAAAETTVESKPEETPDKTSAEETAEEKPEETPRIKAVIVLKRFRDKTDHKTLFVEGQEVKFDVERANDVVTRGLAKFKDGDE
ncbi:MAG: hypothetical protein LBH32_01370 [Dysgonamonadaceae bacterium]|jgi:hypothetical protein|nr:hypothetical protein [Dysgonamonadaceae bacterium]